MLTLHSITENIRTIVKWAAIGLGSILLLFFIYKGIGLFRNTFFPAPPPAPESKFGKLPAIDFPRSISNTKFTYSINTVTGNLPEFPDRVDVFVTVQNKPNLLNLERARSKARNLGFVSSNSSNQTVPERAITDSLYEWISASDPGRKLIMEINTLEFQLTTDYSSNAAVLSAKLLADEGYAIRTTENMLSSIDLLPSDLDETKTRTELYKIQDGLLTSASNLSSTQVIRVDLFQKDVKEIPIVYPDPPHSTMNFLVASGQYDTTIILSSFIHQKISDLSSTYSIKTTQQAYDELKSGNAYVGSYFGSGKSVSITKVSLAYYLGRTRQNYLYPVYVFEGTDGFTAYISALDDAWTVKNETAN